MNLRIIVILVGTIVLPMMTTTSAFARDYVDEWGIYDNRPLPDQSTWRAYYRDHARVQLRPERRLPNGIAWRLHMDGASGVAWPRITWMPDRARMAAANEMLEMAHGGAVLDAANAENWLRNLNAKRRELKWPVLPAKHAIDQLHIDLAYASSRLISVIDLEYVVPEGTLVTKIMRALTFDLEESAVYRLNECAGSDLPYGESWGAEPPNYLFQFGKLLQVCTPAAYREFKRLFVAYAEQAARHHQKSRDVYVQDCIGHYVGDLKNIDDDHEYVVYLTFAGLAVQNATSGLGVDRTACTMYQSSLNPVIIPYRDLEPLMMPSPWRDELLALR
jgi:hypothetical protein